MCNKVVFFFLLSFGFDGFGVEGFVDGGVGFVIFCLGLILWILRWVSLMNECMSFF